jgi:hypothetical protein
MMETQTIFQTLVPQRSNGLISLSPSMEKNDQIAAKFSWIRSILLIFLSSVSIAIIHIVQIDSGAEQASYTMTSGSLLPGVKWQEREADHSPPTSVEVKKTWVYIIAPHTSSWHSA